MRLYLLFSIFLPLHCVYTFAKNTHTTLPLYEWGIAAGSGYINDYPGADHGKIRYIVVPTLMYRGHIFRSDKRGTRARFFKTKRTDIDLSFGASFPTRSKNNETRKGMDDLDWLAEIGPRLNINLHDKENLSIELEVPIRLVFSTDFEFTQKRGYRLYPRLALTKKLSSKLKGHLNYKMNWASEELADYFYEVKQKDTTLTRALYNAKAGYIGSAISLSVSYKFKKLSFGLGMHYSQFSRSTNWQSPLLKSKENISLFIGFNYFFYQSEKKEVRNNF